MRRIDLRLSRCAETARGLAANVERRRITIDMTRCEQDRSPRAAVCSA